MIFFQPSTRRGAIGSSISISPFGVLENIREFQCTSPLTHIKEQLKFNQTEMKSGMPVVTH